MMAQTTFLEKHKSKMAEETIWSLSAPRAFVEITDVLPLIETPVDVRLKSRPIKKLMRQH
jgi:hypothetical protein